jgi:pilus assembly protein CpaC
VDTVVELRDGQSLVIGGLSNTDVPKKPRKIPQLGDIPVLGALFQNSRDTIEENELVVLVSPRIIRPLEMSEVPSLPNPADKKN